MEVRYTDDEIAALIAEAKPLPADFASRARLQPKRGYEESETAVTGGLGNEFCLVMRQSTGNVLDFSVILGVLCPGSNQVFRLRRYNGRSHEHTNAIERERFYDFHIHMATQRYQEHGDREDAYAERCSRFADLAGALACLLNDCGFEVPPKHQLPLFEA